MGPGEHRHLAPAATEAQAMLLIHPNQVFIQGAGGQGIIPCTGPFALGWASTGAHRAFTAATSAVKSWQPGRGPVTPAFPGCLQGWRDPEMTDPVGKGESGKVGPSSTTPCELETVLASLALAGSSQMTAAINSVRTQLASYEEMSPKFNFSGLVEMILPNDVRFSSVNEIFINNYSCRFLFAHPLSMFSFSH